MKGYVEYKMPKALIDNILKSKKVKKGSKQQYLCDYAKNDCGVMGTVIKVIGE